MIVVKHPDSLIGKRYDADTYHCYSFVSECLDMPSLEDIAISTAKQSIEENMPQYIELDVPIDFCLVLMGDRHLGIYVDNTVYHADRDAVKCESLRSVNKKYNSVSFWDKDI